MKKHRKRPVQLAHHGMNVSFQTLTANIHANMEYLHRTPDVSFAGVRSPLVFNPDNTPVALVGGGPSVVLYTDFIRSLNKSADAHVVGVNGSVNWMLQRGITPEAMCMVDAREENKAFIKTVPSNFRYWFASQVAPEIVRSVPPYQLLLWHNAASTEIVGFLRRHGYSGGPIAVPPVWGGPTVMLRALVLAHAMGFRRVMVFGMDCGFTNESHAYANAPEGEVRRVRDGNQVWLTTDWMLAQAQSFMNVAAKLPDLSINVFGDTLLTRLIRRKLKLRNVGVVV